jgi:hypothetical protein
MIGLNINTDEPRLLSANVDTLEVTLKTMTNQRYTSVVISYYDLATDWTTTVFSGTWVFDLAGSPFVERISALIDWFKLAEKLKLANMATPQKRVQEVQNDANSN